MSTTIKYKGNTLATVSNNTKTLKTTGKYMEGDVELTDVSSTVVVSESYDANGGIIKTIDTTNEVNLQAKTVTPTTSAQTINPDNGFLGMSQVVVNPATIEPNNQDKTVSPSTSQQTITADSGYTGLGTVTVNAMPIGTAGTPSASKGTVSNHSISVTPSVTNTTGYITGSTKTGIAVSVSASELVSGTYTVDSSGIKDVTNYASASVPAGTAGTPSASKGTVSNHSISVTPSVTNTTGYITGGTKNGTAVTVSASELVSGTLSVTSNGTKDVTNYASVDVNISSEAPTIQSLSITPSESEQTFNASTVDGYKPVTVSAISSTYVGSEIARRSLTDLTVSGATVSVPAGYYSAAASKSVASGSASAPSSISGTSASVTTGTNTLTLTKTVSVTPVVSAGYVSAGTAGNSSVSLTANVTTQAAKTVTPTESSQTAVAANVYTTGTVTVDAISSTYVGSGITQRSGSDVDVTYSDTSNVLSIQVPSGYYSDNIQKNAPYSSFSTPTITVDSNGLITSSLSVSRGIYKAQTVIATEQLTLRDSTDLTASGATVSVPAGYYAKAASKSVVSGSATGPSSLSGSSASITTGTNTITLTKTGITTTPTVSAGYVSSATASTATVALTASVTVNPTLTVSGATITAPAGYYSAAASKSIDNASLTFNNITNNEPTVARTNNKLTLYADVDVRTASDSVGGYVASGQQTLGTVRVFLYSDEPYFNDNSGLTTSGATVTVPAGYYSSSVSKSVASGSATAPSTISGTAASVSTGNGTLTLTKTVSVTPSVTAGYVSSGTAGNSSVSLTANVTINPTPTASGATVTIPAGYYTEATSKAVTTMTLPTSAASSATSGYTKKATISRSTSTQYINIAPGYNSAGGYYEISAVANGSATGPSSLSGSSATVSTGTNTLTLTKTGVTTTPTVTAGYVSSATASTATVTLTASVTTKAAATITPTTTNQTIAAGTYLTGIQTIAGDADLVGSNILSTANIFGVQGTVDFVDVYIRSAAPTSSVGNDGDIYIQE